MKINKILLILVIVLGVILVGLLAWQNWYRQPDFYAVYLRTGDLYFGRLVNFPYFGLKQVYTIQVNPQNQQTPLSIQRFKNVFWGPQDYLRINRDQVVWITKLEPTGQLYQLIINNPDLLPSPQPPQPPQSSQSPQPSPSPQSSLPSQR